MEDFKTLSDWIVEKDVIGQDKKIGYIHYKAVATFIKKLKEDPLINLDKIDKDLIDKLAGDKLI